MTAISLATVERDGDRRVAVVHAGNAFLLSPATTMRGLLADWRRNLEKVRKDLDSCRLGDPVRLDTLQLLPPVTDPPNLFMAGANYRDHLAEMGNTNPPIRGRDRPFIFLKSPSSLAGDGDEIHPPAESGKVDWEAELGVVLGDGGRIAGYTVVNDLSCRDIWRRENTPPTFTWDWLLQKSWVTACPCGPWLVPADQVADPYDLALRLTVNGEVMQNSNTGQMIFRAEDMIEYLSAYLPLQPGDIIATGTCAGTGAGRGRFLRPGDVMVAEIEGIGRLRNRVAVSFRSDARDG